jgi:hypothetical protein
MYGYSWNMATYGSASGAGGTTSDGGFGSGYHGWVSYETTHPGENHTSRGIEPYTETRTHWVFIPIPRQDASPVVAAVSRLNATGGVQYSWEEALGVGRQTQTGPDQSNPSLYLYFDGSELHIIKNGVSVYKVPAVSGRPQKDGSFDYSVANQKNKSVGPIPAGTYSVNPAHVQKQGMSDYFIGLWVNGVTQSIFGTKTGAWPGGPISWGPMRAWIDGSAYDRNGFSIHGGLSPGSAGCIDLTRQVVPFMIQFQNYAGSSTVPLIVQYPGN